ncbi:class I SAM-dependent methyltransferase [Streptomyces sp. NPDC006251]|uniref:class I SAM-dependent methyltransferase n=1 Tax=Streptomyces sp. NPDC006251 TaxID=3155718 RepID=UPI0033A6A4C6
MLEVDEILVNGTTLRVLVDPEPERADRPALWPSIGEYPIYDPFLYTTMTTDEERNQRFRAALAQLAPDKRVLDIGTGQDLIWARESLRAGARQVLAVEVIEESFRTAAANLPAYGLDDRVTLLRGESTSVEFAPHADVCVAEIIGSLAGAEGAAVVLDDAKRRHLAPSGVVVPHRAVTQAAAVGLADLFGQQPLAFSASSLKYLQDIFNWNGAPFDVRLRIENASPSALLSESGTVEELDFNGTLHTSQRHSTRLTITRAGRMDGVLTWLQLWCLPKEEPLDALRMKTNWASIYFPLFKTPVSVSPGDILDLSLATVVSDDGVRPDYQLSAALRTTDGQEFAGSVDSPHHGGPFRAHPIYQQLFPAD